jgi:hypothetical protein
MWVAMIDNFFWAAALLGEIALTLVLVHKGRWREFPAFTALIASPVVTSLILYPLSRSKISHLYGTVYWTFDFLNVLLQLAVIVELARFVLRPTGTWVRDARKQFLGWGVAGTGVALAFAYLVSPPASGVLQQFELRANLFTSMLVCELCISIMLASNNLGLGWRSHVMAIGQGLTGWAMATLIIDALHSYFGNRRYYATSDYLMDTVYLAALGYWCVQLWANEPARQPISPQLRKYILALHQRVQYDLGKAEH